MTYEYQLWEMVTIFHIITQHNMAQRKSVHVFQNLNIWRNNNKEKYKKIKLRYYVHKIVINC